MDAHTTPAELPALRSIAPDLIHSSRLTRLWILARPFLFLLGFILTAIFASPFWGIPFLVGLFITNICAAHDVVHNALHLDRRTTHALLYLYGIIVMQSGHSFRITHLSHHALYPSKADPEGAASYKTAWQALLMGPLYVPRLLVWAYRRARKQPTERRWMVAEAITGCLVTIAAFALIPVSIVPITYWVVMTLGSWLYPLVTAYLPHDHAGHDAMHQSKSIHGKVMPVILLGLNYHLEHHLYPQVPAHHLGKLSKRLMPYFEAQKATIIQVP